MSLEEKKDVFEILDNYLSQFGDSERKRKEREIRKYFNYSRWSNLKRKFRNIKATKMDYLDRDFKNLLRLLYFGFGVPVQHHLGEKELVTDYTPRIDSLQKCVSLSFEKENAEEFRNKYVNAVRPYIKQAEKRIWVYEYLGKGRAYLPGQVLTDYGQAHEKVFKIIEEHLRNNPKLDYTRLLVLPFSYPIPNRANDKEMTIKALIECSIEVFEHMCLCMSTYEAQAKFYVVWRTTHVHHFGIIDKQYIVSEYYRYNHDGDFVPDLLFIEKVSPNLNDDLRKMLTKLEGEVTKHVSNKNHSRNLNKLLLIEASKEAYQLITMEISKLEEYLQKPLESDPWDMSKEELLDIWRGKLEVMKKKMAALYKAFPDKLRLPNGLSLPELESIETRFHREVG